MKKYFVVAMLLVLSACGYSQRDVNGNIIAPNFQDGSWSTCTLVEKSGAETILPPVQMGGAPMGRTQPDGTKIMCVPIPMVK